MAYFRNKVAGFYVGRDILRDGRGWVVSLSLIPRRDLTPEGHLIWSGLWVTFSIWPGAKPMVRLTVLSMADEIATAIAARAGA